MYQFFVDESQINMQDKRVLLTGDNYNHLVNVLRVKPGEEFAVSNGVDGREYRCSLLTTDGQSALCEIRFIKEAENELPVRVHLYQGLPKSDKMELIIQKLVELGVYEIIPVTMRRCVMKLEDKKVDSRVARWNAISEAAAKQSKRKIIPQVKKPLSYKLAMQEAAQMDYVLVPYELAEGMKKTKELLREIAAKTANVQSEAQLQSEAQPQSEAQLQSEVQPQSEAQLQSEIQPQSEAQPQSVAEAQPDSGIDIAVFIGPEGGIAEDEIALALEKGAQPITLGNRILRTETAGLVTMALIAYEVEAHD